MQFYYTILFSNCIKPPFNQNAVIITFPFFQNWNIFVHVEVGGGGGGGG